MPRHQIFHERAHALLATFQGSPSPRYLVADAKLYTAENATNLAKLGSLNLSDFVVDWKLDGGKCS